MEKHIDRSEFLRGEPNIQENRMKTVREYQKLRLASGLVKYGVAFRRALLYINHNGIKAPKNFTRQLQSEKECFFIALSKNIVEG